MKGGNLYKKQPDAKIECFSRSNSFSIYTLT